MPTTSPIQSPSIETDMPTPYRVPTSAVLIWEPPQPTTAQLTEIRTDISPNRGWWQFPLPTMPWEAVLAFKVWAATVGIGTIALLIHSALQQAR